MSLNPYLCEIQIFSFNFAPKGWALCNGQLLAINQNQALFALLGTTYGGNGVVNFALPNLQGLVPIHTGNGYVMGQTGGEETHVLLPSEMPAHIHRAQADVRAGNANSFNPSNAYPTNTSPVLAFSSGSSNMVAMSPQMVTSYGGGQAHPNQQPYLTLNFCIALQGIFPSQS
jgi:microcystin-dependent protein